MNENKATGHGRRGLLIVVVVLVLDQVSKWWMVFEVMNPPRTSPVLPFFNLVMGWNKGVSFGMFDSDSDMNKWLLICLALAVVAFLLMWMRKAESRRVALAIGMIVGGAIGNVIDRLHFGAVADFLDFYIGSYHWPAFNVADAGITVGAVILVLDSLFTGSEKDTKGPDAS